MSIFGRLKDAIFGSKAEAKPTPPSHPNTSAPAPAAAPTPAASASVPPVDVDAVLTTLAKNQSQKLNWRTSIVDLMKLVGIDSSLENRKALAQELGYTGDPNDSATMNIWLHKRVMKELAAHGGKVPAELTD